MVREFSAGGVVLRRMSGEWQIAVIEPQKEGSEPAPGKRRVARKVILALPKGLVDAGEKPDQTAIREVFEETGPFDERFAPAWFEDVDYCRRLAEAGHTIFVVPAARARRGPSRRSRPRR